MILFFIQVGKPSPWNGIRSYTSKYGPSFDLAGISHLSTLPALGKKPRSEIYHSFNKGRTSSLLSTLYTPKQEKINGHLSLLKRARI